MILYILFIHWWADFVFQTKWMAENKGKSLLPLGFHMAEYFAVMFLMLLPLVAFSTTLVGVFAFTCLNVAAHCVTDFCTSRLTKFAYANMNKPWGNKLFWSTIGLDQYLHAVVMILSVGLL